VILAVNITHLIKDSKTLNHGCQSFITRPPFRQRFLSTITRPRGKLEKPILAPPLTLNYQLVGIAFDYLLRFYLERINVGSKTSLWAAEEGVMLLDPLEGSSDKYKRAKSLLDGARNLYQSFIRDGILTDELISAALWLAYLEGTRRSGVFNEADLVIDERDIADLRQLMSLVRRQDFASRKACYLNPTLGSTGSNADLIIDDKLIDIKTTKDLVLDRRHLHQLVQYYILLSIEGIDGGRKRHINYFEEECEVGQICIYFSRHGYLHLMKIADLINPEHLPGFVKWYIEATHPLEDDLLAYCRKSFGVVPKGIVKEIQAARRLKQKKVSKKTRRKALCSAKG
jgi:hypothetical protein